MSRLQAIIKDLRGAVQAVDQNCALFIRQIHPKAYRHIRWPLGKPYQRKALKIRSPGGGIGDELLASGVIRAIKAANPACEITFVTRYLDFWQGHPLLAAVVPATDENKRGSLELSYRYQIPSNRNVFRLICERVGLDANDFRPAPPEVTPSPWLTAELATQQRPYIIIQPETSNWTPNKAWPLERWQAVAQALSKDHLVIEAGTKPALNPSGSNFLSLASRTNLTDLAFLISKAQLYLGAESGGMHMAAGFNTPAVIVFGGYTSPDNFPYANNIPFYTPVECAPCWLRTPCPYGLKCMDAITASAVIGAAQKFLENKNR